MNYEQLASDEVLNKLVSNLAERGVEGIIVGNKAEALEKIKSLIPAGVSVMNGASATLNEIGFMDYLNSGTHKWKNLHAAITAETDEAKRAQLRKESVLSDYYLGSVHGLAETGESVIGSNSGSQLPHIVFTSPNIIFVVGTNKIVPTLQDAIKRLEEHALPLEDQRAKSIGWPGTQLSKTLIFHKENLKLGRKVRMILVKEKLGF